jgi:hypothetical protein
VEANTIQFPFCLSIVHACMCINNLTIDERIYDDDNTEMRAFVQNEGGGYVEFAEWGSHTTANEGFRGRRRDLKIQNYASG